MHLRGLQKENEDFRFISEKQILEERLLVIEMLN